MSARASGEEAVERHASLLQRHGQELKYKQKECDTLRYGFESSESAFSAMKI